MGDVWRWREDENGDAKAWLHWQNLNEDRNGNPQGFPWHGRAWLHVGEESARVEWCIGSRGCGAAVLFERLHDETVHGMLAFPPIALYFGVSLAAKRVLSRAAAWIARRSADMGARYGHSGSELAVRISDWSLRWNLFSDTSGWESERPRWRDGSWNVLDAALGREKYSARPIEDRAVAIPMPEGSYPALVELTRATWRRPRWFARHVDRANVRLEKPIPVPGKGENSYDCGEDAIHGMSMPASSVEAAIAEVVKSALRDRVRRGGSLAWKPAPKAPAEAEVSP